MPGRREKSNQILNRWLYIDYNKLNAFNLVYWCYLTKFYQAFGYSWDVQLRNPRQCSKGVTSIPLTETKYTILWFEGNITRRLHPPHSIAYIYFMMVRRFLAWTLSYTFLLLWLGFPYATICFNAAQQNIMWAYTLTNETTAPWEFGKYIEVVSLVFGRYL